jgi:hypothetical protein
MSPSFIFSSPYEDRELCSSVQNTAPRTVLCRSLTAAVCVPSLPLCTDCFTAASSTPVWRYSVGGGCWASRFGRFVSRTAASETHCQGFGDAHFVSRLRTRGHFRSLPLCIFMARCSDKAKISSGCNFCLVPVEVTATLPLKVSLVLAAYVHQPARTDYADSRSASSTFASPVRCSTLLLNSIAK